MTHESRIKPRYSCRLSHNLLSHMARLRDALGEIEKSMREKHLACCVLPELEGAGEIANAIDQLSTDGIGALIAIERTMPLENYARTGTVLNARLSASLLRTIFYPGNPLHDGSVIVRDDSVLAAGCVLPISSHDRPFKSRNLGMRHRAAVGLSQISDAVVFVVSEETGRISMAMGGHLFETDLPGSNRRLEAPQGGTILSPA